MDVLYVIGSGSQQKNLELRMSLRSISKYAKNIGKVVVAGRPPQWLSKEVVKVPVEDRFTYKHPNILNCIEKVVDKGIINGEFLYSSDDHFYVNYVDFDNYPYYIKGELRQTIAPSDPYYQYHKSLYDTRMLCVKHQFPTQNYSQHCNTHMHAEVIKEIRPVIHESYLLPFGVEPTSLIMNAWQTREDAPKVELREDVKITRAPNVRSIYEQIGHRDCFSISDSVFYHKAIYDFFGLEYGIKSIFEAE